MSKWYEVKVITVTVFAVEVEDDEDGEKAMEYAMDEVSSDGDVRVENCIEITGDQIEITKRHADEVLAI